MAELISEFQKDVGRNLYVNRLFIYVTIGVAVALSLWLNRTLPRVYEARVSFYVPIAQDVFALATETGGAIRAVPAPMVFRDQLRGYFGILTSERMATRVAESLRDRTSGQIRRGTRFRLTSEGMFFITVADRDPVIAARIANAYADSFNDLFEEISLPRATRTRKFIEDQLAKLRTELATAENEVKVFKEQHMIASPTEETSQLVKQATEFRTQAEITAVSLDEVRTRMSLTEQHLRSESQMQLSSEVVTMNPRVQHLQTKLSDLEIELAGLQTKFTSLHPDVLKIQQQIRETKKHLQEEVRKIIASETLNLNPLYEILRQRLVSLYADEWAFTAKLTGLQEIIGRIEEKLVQLPDLQRRLSELSRTVRHLEETDKALALKLEDARIQEKREIQTFLVVDRALPPPGPAYPSGLVSVPAAGVLGAVAGIFYALFIAYMRDPASYTSAVAVDASGATVLQKL